MIGLSFLYWCGVASLVGGALAEGGATPPKEVTKVVDAAQEAREEKLVKALAQVRFVGRWCLVREGKLGEDKPEEYEIVGIVKGGGERWTINAKIAYGGLQIVAPVPVEIKWAGDTPVIVVDKFSLPGAGTYSARVMLFENTYSGTWTAGDHGGMLHGVILPAGK